MIKPVQFLMVAVLTLTISACAQAPTSGVIVGKIERDLRWGDRRANFDVTNSTEDLKFLTVEAEIEFTGGGLNPHRRTIAHVILPPGATETVSARLYIPGNYGTANGQIRIHDVVDTLDIILPSQKCFEDNFMITFHPPESIQPYLEVELTLPPRVDEHPDFDNQLARLMLVLLNEGKSLDEIAAMTAADTAFVKTMYEAMQSDGYVKWEEDRSVLQFPLITVDEAEQAKQMAEKVSDSLVATVRGNLANYQRVIDSLITTGSLSADSNSFLDGGTILHHPYPVIAGLLLWWDLGQSFITRSAPLLIYDGTDECNAHIPAYMYAVQGGAYFNGTNFYALMSNKSRFGISFGDSLPVLECEENFIRVGQQKRPARFTFSSESRQETFTIDTVLVRPALNALKGEVDSLLVDTYFQLRDLATSFGHAKASYGMRYWFWNLTASRTQVKLVQQAVLKRRGNGQFKFTPHRGRGLRGKKG
ncbi:MAG: hypothetical protein OEV49_14260 [candidate division Zixibacteria bacterium]|nr:hypothetical protein [candidate division Zixibacteria bacterium]MDH3937797.1 hypothetical protein [candidate division Zixibacteria bacterium]MDH4034608.1 hypothetical protein [candidate division Zixibacteria bacterium]